MEIAKKKQKLYEIPPEDISEIDSVHHNIQQ